MTITVVSWVLRIVAAAILLQTLFFKFTAAPESVYIFAEVGAEADLARSCRVVNSVSYGSSQPSVIETNVGRELAYCVGHAVHHYAIIRLICSHLGIVVPEEFGIAPSTLKYRSSLVAD